ncbi:hypothetical protein JNUCC64_04880 [Streptomyces sp. JNUCC 64]
MSDDQTADPRWTPSAAAPPAHTVPPAGTPAAPPYPEPAGPVGHPTGQPGGAPAAPGAAQVPVEARRAWIDGYEPGNPWRASLCFETPYGTVAYPLTPHTMPDLLEGLVMVAQEQQGVVPDPDGETDPDDGYADAPDHPDGAQPARAPGPHGGLAARLTGWTVVHDLWERGDPKVRLVMGTVVVVLLLLGIVLT